jgi:hypothetical protein
MLDYPLKSSAATGSNSSSGSAVTNREATDHP